MKTTSIALGAHFEEYIKTGIKTGRYNNASEMIRAALRLLEEQESMLALRSALSEGIESGIAENFDAKQYLETLKIKRNASTKIQ